MYYIGILKEKLPGFDTHTHTHTHTHTWFSKLTTKKFQIPTQKGVGSFMKTDGSLRVLKCQKGQFSQSEKFKQPEPPVIHNKIKYPPNNSGSKLVME
jgi:hypothetical protein